MTDNKLSSFDGSHFRERFNQSRVMTFQSLLFLQVYNNFFSHRRLKIKGEDNLRQTVRMRVLQVLSNFY